MTQVRAAILREAANIIANQRRVRDAINDFYMERDVDSYAMDVQRALTRAAEAEEKP